MLASSAPFPSTSAVRHRARHSFRASGCERIFEDFAGSESAELGKALEAVSTGDTLVTLSLSQLGRRPRDVARIVARLEYLCAALFTLEEKINTGHSRDSQAARAILALGALDRSRERRAIQAGMQRARALGKQIGRRERITDEQISQAVHLINDESKTCSGAARDLGLPVSTLWKALKRRAEKMDAQT